MFPQLDRVYVNRLAREQLGWQPKYDFLHVLESLRSDQDFRSALARQVGSKGYHSSTMSPFDRRFLIMFASPHHRDT